MRIMDMRKYEPAGRPSPDEIKRRRRKNQELLARVGLSSTGFEGFTKKENHFNSKKES